MDPSKPKSPSSIALELGGTPPTHLADDDHATRSSSTVGPSVEPDLSVSSEDVSSGAVPGGHHRSSLAGNTIPRLWAADRSVDVARNEAAPSLNVMTAALDVPSTTVPDGHRRASVVDANRLSTSVDRDAFVELVHNQDVPLNSNVRSEAALNVRGSLANISTTDASVELARNSAAPFEFMASPARRGLTVASDRGLPRRASVQVADGVSASSSFADSLVRPLTVQAMPSIESSISVRSAVDAVRQSRASTATDASSFSSALDFFTDTSHNQAVPSGSWPTDDHGPSIDTATARRVLVTDNVAPVTGRSSHALQVEQPDDVSFEHVKGSGPPSSASHCTSLNTLAGIGQSMHIAAGAAASLDNPHTSRAIQSLSGDCSSNEHHVNACSSIAAEASSQVDAGLMHEVGAAASCLQEAAASLTNVAASLAEAAALLSKAGVVSSSPLHEQPCGVGAQSTSTSTLLTDVGQTEDSPPQAVHNEQDQARPDVQNPSQAPGTPEVKPDPALVVALTTAMGEPTGWAAIEKAMTKYDREEIGGYKEDIDSLLTFTGLYSAVLTAFVIVSYPLLQAQDPASGSTSTPSIPSSSFHPPISAIRINILWFASLVISLATASFAILVKQWLRSYLKFASASPQGQLRIRHFRHAGLEVWKVFGIASTLPLMLQVSLALFFAGLCIFTFDVHPTIGYTTLPLVCVWLSLFAVVTVSPSFTARCPYTTPALQGYTYTLRCHIYPVFVTVFMKYICFGVFMGVFCMLSPILFVLYVLEDVCATSKIIEHVIDSMGAIAQYFGGHELSKPTEEAGMINDTRHDLEILASADALQADDRLLGTTIKSALKQSDTNWVQLIEFAVQIIGNRVPVIDSETNLEHILSAYRSLSPSVRSVINEIFQSHVISKVTKTIDDSVTLTTNWQWQTIVRWTCCIIMQLNNTPKFSQPQNTSPEEISTAVSGSDGEKIWQSLKAALILSRTTYFSLSSNSTDNVKLEKWLVKQCLTFPYTTICQPFKAVYTNVEEMHQLSNVIHNIVEYHSSDFKILKAIEILKLSLLSVRVMYGKIHDDQDSRPRWSSDEAAQWKRTFIWLAYRLDNYRQLASLEPSADELAALQQLVRSGWGAITDPTEDSSQQALPIPDYFYLMLWWTAGEDLSQISSRHPQLLRVAHMSSDEQYAIWSKGYHMAEAYRDHPGNLYPPGVEDNNGQGQECRATSAAAQGIQDPIPNDPRVGACELGVSGGLQQGYVYCVTGSTIFRV